MKSQAKFNNFRLKNALENGICEIALNLPRSKYVAFTTVLMFVMTYMRYERDSRAYISQYPSQCTGHNATMNLLNFPVCIDKLNVSRVVYPTEAHAITTNHTKSGLNEWVYFRHKDGFRATRPDVFWQPQNSGHISWLWPTIAWLIGFIAID